MHVILIEDIPIFCSHKITYQFSFPFIKDQQFLFNFTAARVQYIYSRMDKKKVFLPFFFFLTWLERKEIVGGARERESERKRLEKTTKKL